MAKTRQATAKEMATIQRTIRERWGEANANKMLAYMGLSLNFARSVRMAAKAISFPEFTNLVNREIIKRITRSGHGPRGRVTISMEDARKAAIGGDVVGVEITPEEAAQHGHVFDEHGFLKKVGLAKPPPLAYTPMRHNFRGGRAWCFASSTKFEDQESMFPGSFRLPVWSMDIRQRDRRSSRRFV